MNANEKKLQEILSGANQYVVPLFQRHYSWTDVHWIPLLNDIRRLHEANNPHQQHFMGSLVCMAEAPMPGTVTGYQIIDGQQRLTTLTILLAAIRDLARAKGYDNLAEEITETFLIHRHRKGLERFKILSRVGDREALISIVEGNADPKLFENTGVDEAWRFFKRQLGLLAGDGSEAQLRAILATVVSKLSLVFILVNNEDPYEIFESLNTRGLPLSQADLVRNFVFMKVDMSDQEEFDRAHWKPMEDEIKKAKSEDKDEDVLTPFFRDYLMVTGHFVEAQAVFSEFKTFFSKSKMTPAQLVADLKKYLPCSIWLRKPELCDIPPLRIVLEDFAFSDIVSANPLILSMYRAWQEQRITAEQFTDCMRDLVSFALRRSICGEGTGGYARWFVEAINECRIDPQTALRTYLNRRGWPDDTVFTERLTLFPLYRRESLKARMVLLGLERSHDHKEEVKPDTLTIEHVMPQTISNSACGKAWKAMLGPDWEQDLENLLHVLGNLTLTGYNTPLSNHAYPDKRTEYAKSHIELNKYFSGHEQWNAATIRARSVALAQTVAALWPRTTTGAYKPPVGVDTAALGEGKRVRYWNDFRTVLGERMPELQAFSISNRSLYLKNQADDAFLLNIYINPKTGNVQIGIDAAMDCDKVARPLIETLAKHKDSWNAKLGFSARWLAEEISHLVADVDTEGAASQEYDWPVEHSWAVPRLKGFTTIILPELERILGDPAALKSALAGVKEYHLENFLYWQPFRKVLKASWPLPLRHGASANRNYRQILATEDIDLSAGFDGESCYVYLLTKREDVAQKFSNVVTTRDFASIMEALGAQLEQQIPPEGRSWLCLWKPCDATDLADRPNQYNWLLQGLTLLRERIIPFIEATDETKQA